MKSQQGIRVMPTQEQALLDKTSRGVHQGHGVHLRFAAARAIDTGGIQHGNDATILIMDGCAGTGQPDVPRAKVIRLVNGYRTRLARASTYTVGALVLLAPLSTDHQAGG